MEKEEREEWKWGREGWERRQWPDWEKRRRMPKRVERGKKSRKMGSFLPSKFFLPFHPLYTFSLYLSFSIFLFLVDFELQVTSLLWFILRFSLVETFPLKQDVSLPFHSVTNKLKVFLSCFCVIYVNSFPLKDLESTIRKFESYHRNLRHTLFGEIV